MKFRLSTLFILSTLFGLCVVLANHWCSQPDWLASLRGKTQTHVNETIGKKTFVSDFVPAQSALAKQRRRLRNTLPANCDAVRELQWRKDNYVYYAWLHLQDGKWVVFDTSYHHEDRAIIFDDYLD